MQLRSIDTGLLRLDLVPLIDVVFQLLMFFLVAASFAYSRTDEQSKLPVSALAKPPDPTPDKELNLELSYDGHRESRAVVFHNGANVPLIEMPRQLERAARSFLENAEPSEPALADVDVIIRADPDIPAGLVQELIEQCQQAKFTRFSLKRSTVR